MMGTYRIKDLSDPGRGSLYEGKVIVEKTYGHATYGCAQCCGVNPEKVYMLYNPIGVGVGSYATQSVMAPNACEPSDIEDITGDFPNWGTDDASIATVDPAAQVNGIGVGSTTHFTSGEAYAGEGHSIDNKCPMDELEPQAGTNVVPVITSFDPNPIMIGVSNTSLTINGMGFGTNPTVSLPAGITSSGQGSTDAKIVLQGVNVALSTTVGNNNVTVSASGQTSAPAALTVDGP